MNIALRRFAVISTLLLSITACAAAQGLITAKPSEAGMSAERLNRITRVMGQRVDNRDISGAVTLVARRGKEVHFKAHGMADIENGIPMKNDTIFRIASMTKAVTTVAVMMLYEEGNFVLTDPVSKYIPEFKDLEVMLTPPESYEHAAASSYVLVPAKREMTIRHLLNHTSGLTSTLWKRPYLDDLYRKELAELSQLEKSQSKTIHELVRILGRLPLHHHPGDAFEYGFSTDVLGYLIEAVSGMTFDEYLRENVFEPLGMEDTFFYVPDDKLERLAVLYAPTEDGGLTARNRGYRGSKTYFSGAGGLFSTAGDYARFLQMLLNGGTLDGKRYLSRKTVEIMTTDSLGDLKATWPALHGDTFGLGFGIRTERGMYDEIESIGTYSWGGVFNTIFYVDPSEELIAIFMNQLLPQDHLNIREQFRVLAFQAIDD